MRSRIKKVPCLLFTNQSIQVWALFVAQLDQSWSQTLILVLSDDRQPIHCCSKGSRPLPFWGKIDKGCFRLQYILELLRWWRRVSYSPQWSVDTHVTGSDYFFGCGASALPIGSTAAQQSNNVAVGFVKHGPYPTIPIQIPSDVRHCFRLSTTTKMSYSSIFICCYSMCRWIKTPL